MPTYEFKFSKCDHLFEVMGRYAYWNSKRIVAEMDRRQIYRVGHTHIDELLRAEGCARGSVPPRPGPR